MDSIRPLDPNPAKIVGGPETDEHGHALFRVQCSEHPYRGVRVGDDDTGPTMSRKEAEFRLRDHLYMRHPGVLGRGVVARFDAGTDAATLGKTLAEFGGNAHDKRHLRVFGCPDGSVEVGLE